MIVPSPPSSSVLSDEATAAIAESILEAVRARLDSGQSREPLLSLKQVATRLSVSRRTIETMIAEREIPSIWVRGQRRFEREAIEDYLSQNTRTADVPSPPTTD